MQHSINTFHNSSSIPVIQRPIKCYSGVARRLSKMGKKVDRAKTDKSSSSGHHGESADDGNKSPGGCLFYEP